MGRYVEVEEGVGVRAQSLGGGVFVRHDERGLVRVEVEDDDGPVLLGGYQVAHAVESGQVDLLPRHCDVQVRITLGRRVPLVGEGLPRVLVGGLGLVRHDLEVHERFELVQNHMNVVDLLRLGELGAALFGASQVRLDEVLMNVEFVSQDLLYIRYPTYFDVPIFLQYLSGSVFVLDSVQPIPLGRNDFGVAFGILPVVAGQGLVAQPLDVQVHELRLGQEVAPADFAERQRVHLRGADESGGLRVAHLLAGGGGRVVDALVEGEDLLAAGDGQVQVGVLGALVDELLDARVVGVDVDPAPPLRVQVERVRLVHRVVGADVRVVPVLAVSE